VTSSVSYRIEDACDWAWRGPEWLRPAVGGLLIGGLLLVLPQMYGVGYPVLENAVQGKYVIGFLLILMVGKMLATSLAIGVGGSGGVFAPTLFIGAMAGTAFGDVAHLLAPTLTAPADPDAFQPRPFVGHHVRQAQPHRQRLQRHHQAHNAAAEHVDPDRHIRATDRQSVRLIDHDHIDHRVIDLHPLEHGVHRRHLATDRLQLPGGVRPLPRRRPRHRIQPGDPSCDRPARRHPQPTPAAHSLGLPVHRRHRLPLPGQVLLPQHLPDHRLHLIRQVAPATTAAGAARDQVRDHALTLTPATQQHIHLPP